MPSILHLSSYILFTTYISWSAFSEKEDKAHRDGHSLSLSPPETNPEHKIEVQAVYLGVDPRNHPWSVKSKTGSGKQPVEGTLFSQRSLWVTGT